MQLTLGELHNVIKYHRKQEEAKQKAETINAAFCALYSAYFNRTRHFPNSLEEAFPTLFGRTETGGIPVSDWQRAKAEMEKIRNFHNAAIRKEVANK